jgi:hypothetical protein
VRKPGMTIKIDLEEFVKLSDIHLGAHLGAQIIDQGQA